jgi:hypothetical protein
MYLLDLSLGSIPLQNSPLVHRHTDSSAVATAGTRAGSPVLEVYQGRSTIPAGSPPFLSKRRPLSCNFITGEESWVYGRDPETKQQSSQWKSPGSPKPKARQSRSATKSMLIVFFDIRGMLHLEFAPEGRTVNAEFYCSVLRRLMEDIQRKRP